METKDIRKVISESKAFLEDYRAYGPMITDAINALDRLDVLISEPSKEHLAEASDLAKQLNDQLSPYRGFVPTLAENSDQILQWLSQRA